MNLLFIFHKFIIILFIYNSNSFYFNYKMKNIRDCTRLNNYLNSSKLIDNQIIPNISQNIPNNNQIIPINYSDKIINYSDKIIIDSYYVGMFISITILFFSMFMIINGKDERSYLPIITGLIGTWLPQPSQKR
jgi:hypothetical protein